MTIARLQLASGAFRIANHHYASGPSGNRAMPPTRRCAGGITVCIDCLARCLYGTKGPSIVQDRPNHVICHGVGVVAMKNFSSSTVDEVLECLWQTDRIEGIMTLGGRNPSLDSIRRVLPNRVRLWGDDGRYQSHP